jgi:hypothetical protein
LNKKIKVAFIYKKSNIFLTGKHFDNGYYHFFIESLSHDPRLDVSYFPAEDKFNTRVLNDKFDIILLFGNHEWEIPNELEGINDLGIPVIARAGEPHKAYKEGINVSHKKYNIDHYFGFFHEASFHKFYPLDFKYKTVIFGLKTSLYQNLTPFDMRIKNRILNTGAVGTRKITSKLRAWIRDNESNSNKQYKLRTMCNELSYVDYTSTLNHRYVNDQYPLLLSKYTGVIASTTYFPTKKYWEIPAAGCLTFMEITKKNHGEYLGFIDNESAIFINEENYKEKFEEFLSEPDNPKWKKIASNGKKHAIEDLSNEKAVDALINIMKIFL